VGRDARDFCAEIEDDVLRKFVTARAAAPDVGDKVSGVLPKGKVKSLHVGRGRAATIWDPIEGVCWLLAYDGMHATGERRDVYQYFMKLSTDDGLLPTIDDYDAIDETTEAYLMDRLVEQAAGIYLDARADPGTEFNATYDKNSAFVVLDVIVEQDGEMEEGWISIGFARDTPLSAATALDVISRILPRHINIDMLDHAASFHGRPLRGDEIVFTWTFVS